MPAVPAVKLVVAEVKIPPPVMPEAALLAFNVKEEPEDVFNVTLPALISMALTTPVEFSVRVLAFKVLAPVKEMPAVPEVRLAVAAVSAPAAVIPDAALEPFRVNDVPEEAFNVTMPAFVSTMFTVPVELAVNVDAEVEAPALMVMPPVPEETVKVGVVSVEVVDTEPAPPGVAVNEIELAADRAAVRVTLPAVELSEMLLAVMLPPTPAVLIVLLAVILT